MVSKFRSLKILVIGDVILDAYYHGNVKRISPEAPVPVFDLTTKEFRLGGAANVALNIAGLGAEVMLCSVVGDDDAGKRVKELMEESGLSNKSLITSEQRPTSIKTRLMSSSTHVIRVDEESTNPLDSNEEKRLIAQLNELLEQSFDAIVFQDYDKGVLTKNTIEWTINKAKQLGIPTAVDPKKRNFFSYAGASLFKPNMKELTEGLDDDSIKAEANSLKNAFDRLTKKMPVDSAFFTLSEHGVFITNGNEAHHISAHRRIIADVSGAGDTVIATATCALASNMPLKEIASISNLAGGWACQFPGVVSITLDHLTEEIKKHF